MCSGDWVCIFIAFYGGTLFMCLAYCNYMFNLYSYSTSRNECELLYKVWKAVMCLRVYRYLRNILIINTNEMHYFSNLFWHRTPHVSDRFTVHHQESSTVYTAIGVCHTGYANCLLARSGWNFEFHPDLANRQSA